MSHIEEDERTEPEKIFPCGFLQLHSVLSIENACDSLTLLLHTILLEVGFVPKDVSSSDIYKCMPKDWNSNGIYKIRYYHKDFPEALCWVTFVPFYRNITIQGTLVSEHLEDNNVHMKLSLDSFVISKEDVSDPFKLFIHVDELTRKFKDELCFGLLVLVQEISNYKPAFGLNGLLDDVKISILRLLPVESVVALSGVNKQFNQQANGLDLWKFLYSRDYNSDKTFPTSNVEEDWKELYKSEYLKRKRQQAFRAAPCVFPSHYLQQIYPVGPNFDFDPRINMDPALQIAFPHMRSRFRQSNWPYPRWNGFHYFGRF